MAGLLRYRTILTIDRDRYWGTATTTTTRTTTRNAFTLSNNPSFNTELLAIYYLCGISKYTAQYPLGGMSGLSGDTTVQLVQLYQLVCGVVSWCGVSLVYHCVQNTFSPRGLQKKSSLCVTKRTYSHFTTKVYYLDENKSKTEQVFFICSNCFNKQGNTPDSDYY